MNELLASGPAPLKPWITSLTRTNQFAAGQLEKWATLQMDKLRSYVDLGVAQAKVAFKISDPHSLYDFVDSQFAVCSFVGHRIVDDGRALVDWSNDCAIQAHRVGRANMLSLLFKD